MTKHQFLCFGLAIGVLLGGIFGLFLSASASDINIAGAGESTVNQDYIDQGGGEWHSQDSTIKLCTYDGGGGDYYAILTLIGDTCGSGASEYYKHFGTAFDTADLVASGGTWNAPMGWSAPGPVTITELGGGSSPTSVSTSTLEQSQTNLYNAFIIFFISMIFVIWFFKS